MKLSMFVSTACLLFGASVSLHAAEPAVSSSGAEAWRTECSSCHIAYPPRLLSAESWREIMRTLDKHFGVDASVDAPLAEAISQYLTANAGRSRYVTTAGTVSPSSPPRITELPWFKREHDEERAYVGPGKKVTTWSDCAACHANAGQGRFSEHDIRIPK